MNATTTYSVTVNGETFTKRSAARAYPFAIVMTWTAEFYSDADDADKVTGTAERVKVSFAGDLPKAQAEVRTRLNNLKYRDLVLDIVPTTAA